MNIQLIIISGPSGSGKTTLSKKILKKIKDGIILNTDNYYKTGLLSQILSKIITCYFDRKISFNNKLFRKDLTFILKNGFINSFHVYDFKNKSIKKKDKKIENIKFVIVEGIFGHEILNNISINNCILINLQTNKKSCMKRVIKRDFLERGKSKNEAKKDFLKAWSLFYKNKKKHNSRNHLKEIFIRKKSELKLLLKHFTRIVN